MRVVHLYFSLLDGLHYMLLRIIVAHDCCSYLVQWVLIDFSAPDMVLWRASCTFTLDIVHSLLDMSCVMQRIRSPND